MSNMKQITTAKGTYLFVEVPNNVSIKYRVWNDLSGTKDKRFCYLVSDRGSENHYLKLGKPNTFELISTANQITEKQAESIVDDCDIYAKCWKKYDYLGDREIGGRFCSEYSCWAAKESLQSLIKANGLDETKNYLILKKVE